MKAAGQHLYLGDSSKAEHDRSEMLASCPRSARRRTSISRSVWDGL